MAREVVLEGEHGLLAVRGHEAVLAGHHGLIAVDMNVHVLQRLRLNLNATGSGSNMRCSWDARTPVGALDCSTLTMPSMSAIRASSFHTPPMASRLSRTSGPDQ